MKQVIVLRADLKLGKGKLVAQGAHASLAYAIWGITAYVAIRSGAFSGLWRANGAQGTGAASPA